MINLANFFSILGFHLFDKIDCLGINGVIRVTVTSKDFPLFPSLGPFTQFTQLLDSKFGEVTIIHRMCRFASLFPIIFRIILFETAKFLPFDFKVGIYLG